MKSLVVLLLLAASPAVAQVHEKDVESRLAALVGDWTIPGEERTYRETCNWYRNQSFIVCTSEDTSDNSMSQSILGYSKSENHFTYHNFGSTGSSNSRIGFPDGERGLIYTQERKTSKGIVRATTKVTPLPDGRVHFAEERSTNGGPWVTAADFYYVRRINVSTP